MRKPRDVIVWRALLATIADMADVHGDALWDQFVILMLAAGPVQEGSLATATSRRCSPVAARSLTWRHPA
jgi:hypothetical protein